jgi:transposase
MSYPPAELLGRVERRRRFSVEQKLAVLSEATALGATSTEVSTTGLADTKGRRGVGKRRQWPEVLKRRIVAETLEPGSSVSIVARRHDVNANQLFKWRREMAAKQTRAAAAGVPMLPVEIVSELPGERPEEPAGPRPRARRSGVIEITFGCGTRVCLRGEVPPETLRQVIELLR